MKPSLPMYLLHKQHGHLPVEVFLFSGSGKSCHYFETNDEILSVPKRTILSFLHCSPLLYLRLYGYAYKRVNLKLFLLKLFLLLRSIEEYDLTSSLAQLMCYAAKILDRDYHFSGTRLPS